MRFSARSAPATMALPTYIPIEPPMKAKSWPTQTAFSRPISPSATSIASSSPVFLRASRSRSGYFFWSRKPSGSATGFGTGTSTKTPPSNSARKRSRGPIAR